MEDRTTSQSQDDFLVKICLRMCHLNFDGGELDFDGGGDFSSKSHWGFRVSYNYKFHQIYEQNKNVTNPSKGNQKNLKVFW